MSRMTADAAVQRELAEGLRPAWPTVGELADAEALMALPPVPFPGSTGRTRR